MSDQTFEEYKAEIDAETLRLKTLFGQFKKEFPNLYSEMTEYYMFDVPKGWVDLVYSLSKRLEPFNIQAVQVKRKFDGLRFYIKSYENKEVKYLNNISDSVESLICSFESVSVSICEHCGSLRASTNFDRSFVETLCNSCLEIRDSVSKT